MIRIILLYTLLLFGLSAKAQYIPQGSTSGGIRFVGGICIDSVLNIPVRDTTVFMPAAAIRMKGRMTMRPQDGLLYYYSGAHWDKVGIGNITGLIVAGSNVTITGSGTQGSPYVISATGGGGGGSLDTAFLMSRINNNGLFSMDTKTLPENPLNIYQFASVILPGPNDIAIIGWTASNHTGYGQVFFCKKNGNGVYTAFKTLSSQISAAYGAYRSPNGDSILIVTGDNVVQVIGGTNRTTLYTYRSFNANSANPTFDTVTSTYPFLGRPGEFFGCPYGKLVRSPASGKIISETQNFDPSFGGVGYYFSAVMSTSNWGASAWDSGKHIFAGGDEGALLPIPDAGKAQGYTMYAICRSNSHNGSGVENDFTGYCFSSSDAETTWTAVGTVRIKNFDSVLGGSNDQYNRPWDLTYFKNRVYITCGDRSPNRDWAVRLFNCDTAVKSHTDSTTTGKYRTIFRADAAYKGNGGPYNFGYPMVFEWQNDLWTAIYDLPQNVVGPSVGVGVENPMMKVTGIGYGDFRTAVTAIPANTVIYIDTFNVRYLDAYGYYDSGYVSFNQSGSYNYTFNCRWDGDPLASKRIVQLRVIDKNVYTGGNSGFAGTPYETIVGLGSLRYNGVDVNKNMVTLSGSFFAKAGQLLQLVVQHNDPNGTLNLNDIHLYIEKK